MKVHYDLFSHLGNYKPIIRLVLEGKTSKEIPQTSRLEFLKRFSANNFPLSDGEDKTSGLLNRRGIADLP